MQEHVDQYDEYLPWAQRGLALYGREKEGRSLVYVYILVKLVDLKQSSFDKSDWASNSKA